MAECREGRRPKICRQCEHLLPMEAFQSRAFKVCIECAEGKKKYCPRCFQAKPKTEFTRSADRKKDGLFGFCRECHGQGRKGKKRKRISAEQSLKLSLGLG